MIRGAEIIVSIDPKLTGSGFAIGKGRKLLNAGTADVPKAVLDLEGRIEFQLAYIRGRLAEACGTLHPDTVVSEFPRVYPGTANRTDPNDLVDLAGLAAALGAALAGDNGRLHMPYPRNWKGTMPKDVHHRRLAQTHPLAVPIVNRSSARKRLDVWDAVGLLFWYTDLTGRGG